MAIVWTVGVGQIFNSFTLYNRSNLAGLHYFKTDTFISILDKLIMIGICAPILFFNVFTAHFDIRMFILFREVVGFVLCPAGLVTVSDFCNFAGNEFLRRRRG